MSWPWRRSIQARIILILVGLLGAVLLILNLRMDRLLEKAQLDEAANHLQIQAMIAANSLEDPLSVYRHELEEYERDHDDGHDDEEHHSEEEEHGGSFSHLPGWASTYSEETGAKVTVTDKQGRVLVGTEPALTSEELDLARRGLPSHRWTSSTIHATAPVWQRERLLGIVRLSVPRSVARLRSRELSLSLAFTSAMALALALAASVFLSRRLVKPLNRLEESAGRVSRGEWEHAVSVDGEDELASLSRAFSKMVTELQRTFEQQRLFVANASHELRTPLTRMKLRTEALVDGGLDDEAVAEKFVREIDGEVDRLAQMTNSLLDLARLEESSETRKTDEPKQVLREAFELVARPDRELVTNLPESLPPLRIAPENLRLVATNLLENAFKYSSPGGKVRFVVERAGAGITMVVEDEGAGIAPEHLPHLFERFYRVDPVRTKGGSGLGLALVKAAVESAGGKVRVESEVGKGSRFFVELPGC